MASPAFLLSAVLDEADPQLNASISASDTTIVLKSGHGAQLPTTYSGAASSTGTGTLLNDTGGLGDLAVGDFIENVTDGSWAVVLSIAGAPDAVTTTALSGGSDNTWTSGDAWYVNRFVVCLAKVDADGDVTQSELALINSRSTDTLTVATGGRGYDGSSAAEFDADDYCFLFVIRDHVKQLQQAIRNHEMKFDELRKGQWNFASDAGANDTYVITLSPAPSAYATGMDITFAANTINTGACTINVNSLGAKSLKILKDQDPPNGYIKADAVVKATYDGTNFVITSVTATPGAGVVKSNTDGATVTFDVGASDCHTVTLEDNRTLALSNDQDGQMFMIILKQDGTGSRTVTWWSNIKWAGGGAPTLTTTLNKYDAFCFVRVTSTEYLGFIVGQNL